MLENVFKIAIDPLFPPPNDPKLYNFEKLGGISIF